MISHNENHFGRLIHENRLFIQWIPNNKEFIVKDVSRTEFPHIQHISELFPKKKI